jgi:hypothetical protein
MTSAWEKYKEKNGVTPMDLLNPKSERADENVSSERFSICKACPELIKLTSQCKKCGCFMNLKTTLKIAKCPLGKW